MNPERIAEQLKPLPDFLGAHLQLTLVALVVGIGLSLPLALVVLRWRVLQGPLLGLAAVIQTIPSLALLALMVPLLGKIGFLPAVIALTLYSILPVLRNTVTGIESTDPVLLEAARGVGMTPMQVLLRVQVPLAAPVIIAGIRTATVWVVGIATLSTPVGATSLGNYIFTGLQTQNPAAVLVGCVSAALLALALDGLIRLMEVATSRRSRLLASLSSVGIAGVVALAFLPNLLTLTRKAEPVTGPRVVVGSKSFTEQYILAQFLTDYLKNRGFATEKTAGMGSSILFDSLASGNVDCYVDYSGTIWANILKRKDIADRETVLKEVTRHLKTEYGITCLGILGFENTYALAIPRAKAEKLGVRTLRALSRFAPRLIIGGDYEFFGRPEWTTLRAKYGFRFKQRVRMDASLMYQAAKAGEVDVIAAFSSDGRIAAYDLTVLEDNERAFPPYDAILLLSPGASDTPGLRAALEPLLGAITDEKMRQANRVVDVDSGSVEQAATALRNSMSNP